MTFLRGMGRWMGGAALGTALLAMTACGEAERAGIEGSEGSRTLNWMFSVDAGTEDELLAALTSLDSLESGLVSEGYARLSERSSPAGEDGEGPEAVERTYGTDHPTLGRVRLWIGRFETVLDGTEISLRLSATPVPVSDEEKAAWEGLQQQIRGRFTGSGP